MPKLSRAVRFEVTFPGWRSTDLFGAPRNVKKAKRKRADAPRGLYERLWGIQADLTEAANRLVSALWQIHLGTIPWPLRPGKDGEERVPAQTLAYQGLSGKWVGPDGQPFYRPTHERVGSYVLLDLATVVHTRLTEDLVDVRRGRKSLPTFRGLPIGITSHGVAVKENGDITLSFFAGRGGAITVAPRKVDDGARAVLRRIAAEAYKGGGARLRWFAPDGRKGKWLLSVQWTGDVAAAEGTVYAGLDIGMRTTATLCCVSTASGKATRSVDLLRLPASVVRGWRRLEAVRRERSKSNRLVFGKREGRGVQRKLRSVEAISNAYARLTDEEVRQLAAAVVQQAKARGAVGIALEDLTTWSVGRMVDETGRGSNRDAAEARKRWFFSWHQGAIRAQVREAAEREGLHVAVVEARNSSRTCAACGLVYPEVYPCCKPAEFGYVAWDRFVCSCGWKAHGERNAALVLAQRGLAAWKESLARAVPPG